MKKRKYKRDEASLRIMALFCSVIIFSSIFSFAFSLQTPVAKAAEVGCCGKPNTGGYCANNSDSDACSLNPNYFHVDSLSCDSSKVPECQVGVCIPSERGAECMVNVRKIACEDSGGKWVQANSKDEVPECQKKCCNIANADCSILESKVCEDDGGNIVEGITDAAACDLECKKEEVGCCGKTDGSFSNILRGQCSEQSGRFYGNNIWCSQVNEARIQGCTEIRPGNGLTDDDKFDCYCYDGKGNREGIATGPNYLKINNAIVPNGGGLDDFSGTGGNCSINDQICSDPDGNGGNPAWCKSTSCVTGVTAAYPDSLKNGWSTCLNVMPGHFNPDDRSKGLQSYILRCQYGDIKPDMVDPNGNVLDSTRERVCIDGGDASGWFATTVSNNWKDCVNCGMAAPDPNNFGNTGIVEGFTDAISFIPLIGPPISNWLGKTCRGNIVGWEPILSLGAGEACRDKGNGTGIQMCGGGNNGQDYDYDLWAPLGSCNPIYPPGNSSSKCKLCGAGGDAVTNVCTEEECNHLGDCQFNADAWPGGGIMEVGMVMLGSCAAAWVGAGACAVFTLGTQATTCVTGAGAFCAGLLGVGQGWPLIAGAAMWTGVSFAGAAQSQVKQYSIKDLNSTVSGHTGKYQLGYVLVASKIISEELSTIATSEQVNQSFSGIQTSPTQWPGATANALMITNALGGVSGLAAKGVLQGISFTDMIGQTIATAWRDNVFGDAAKKVGLTLNRLKLGLDTSEIIDVAQKKLITDFNNFGTANVWKFSFNILQTIGLFVNLYGAARSMNPGTCAEESAYSADSAKCGNCGAAEGQWYCTKERCDILGTNCKWFVKPDAKEDGLCIAVKTTDVTIPSVEKWTLRFYDSNQSQIGQPVNIPGNAGTAVWPTSGGKVPYNSSYVSIEINTNEESQCKYTQSGGQDYNSAMTSFADESAYPRDHKTDKIALIRGAKTDYIFYVKCKDLNGNVNSASDDKNYIKFTTVAAPDRQPPSIEYLKPENIFMPPSTTNVTFSLLTYDTNNVSSCKYSPTSINWDNMTTMNRIGAIGRSKCVVTNTTACDLFQSTILLTNGTLAQFNTGDEIINVTTYRIYFNCIDNAKPTGNKGITVMGNVYDYLNRTVTLIPGFNVTVNSPIPSPELYYEDVDINVTTGRVSTCNYVIDSKKYTFDDPPQGVKGHVITHNESLSVGEHTIFAECEDIANNIMTSSPVKFNVAADLAAPMIIRAYYKDGYLKILTDEISTCAFSFDSCNFKFDETEKMPFDNSKEHTALWRTDVVYYIVCKDRGSHMPGQGLCSAIIHPYELITSNLATA